MDNSIEVEPCLEEVQAQLKGVLDESSKAKKTVSFDPPPYEPKVPFPGRVKKQLLENQKKKLLEIVDKIESDIPFLDGIDTNPRLEKSFKELITKGSNGMKGIMMAECKAIKEAAKPQAPLPIKTLVKNKHSGKFIIPCSIGGKTLNDALCDSGALVNVISWDMVKEIGLKGMKPDSTPLVFGDASKKTPKGIIEDYPILVGNCIVPTDLLVLDMVDSMQQPLILGAPFLATVGAVIDYFKKVVILKNLDESICYAMEPSIAFCGATTIGKTTIELNEGTKVEYTSLLVMDSLEVGKEFGNEVPLVKGVSSREVETKLKEGVTMVKVGKVGRKKKLKKAECEIHESSPPSLTLKPLKIIDGKLECKVKSRGYSRPFSKVRIILDSVSTTQGDLGVVTEKMASHFGIKQGDRGPIKGGSPPEKA